MSLSALETTLNAAFDARDTVSTATTGEVRDAVELALDMLEQARGEGRLAGRPTANGRSTSG